jgi:hypothetical protein
MGERGRARALEQYSLSRVVDTWETTYRELLDGSSAELLASSGQR